MNPTVAQMLQAVAPPQSEVHQVLAEQRAKEACEKKARDSFAAEDARALRLQIQSNPKDWI